MKQATVTTDEKFPPYSEQSEMAVLGSLLIDPTAVSEIAATLNANMFYLAKHKLVYEAILQLWQAGRPLDFLTLTEKLRANDCIEYAGGEPYIITLIQTVPTSINVRQYAENVQEMYTRRQLINSANSVLGAAYNLSMDINESIRQSETAILTVRAGDRRDRMITAEAAANGFIDDMQNEKPVGIPTGYIDLDRCIGGLEPQTGYWFCGAEKMGKTSFVNWISLSNALSGRVVLRLSLEMSAKQRIRRDVAALTGLSVKALKARKLTPSQMERAYEAAGRISSLNLVTEETPGQSPSHMRAACNRVLAEYGRIDLVELDYFQLCQADRPTSNRVQDLEEISKALVSIIKDFDVPLVGTAQITSKSIAQRSNKEPELTDVFGSSALARDAYFIAFIHRDEYYNPETTIRPGEADLIVKAHRDGDTPRIPLQFSAQQALFRNLNRTSPPT